MSDSEEENDPLPLPPEEGAGSEAGGGPGENGPPPRKVLVREVTLATLVIVGLAMIPGFSVGSGSVRLDHPLLLTAALIYLPFIPYAQRRISLSEMGLGATGFRKGVKLAAVTSVIVFPLFLLIWYAVGGTALGLPSPRPLTSEFPFGGYEWADLVARQFLGAAIPEEWFFRGYLQRRIEQLTDKRFGKGRFQISLANVLTAWLFALAHAARYGSLLRLNVFFPGLLFGWARERGGHLVAPILLHALSNLVLRAFVG